MDHMTQMVIRTSLRGMFSKGRVDICAIKECLKLAGVTPTGPVLDHLSALHCIYFKDMERELAEAIPNMVAGLFDGMRLDVMDLFLSPVKVKIIGISPEPAKNRHPILKLLGI